jgi:hypothetical protein
MRTLNRNKRNTHFASLIGTEPIYDEWGNETGEENPVYSDVKELDCNISPAVGEETISAFGSFTDYSRVIVGDVNCPLAEKYIVWFGVSPEGPHNYIVVKKADSKNGNLYALQEVEVR